MPFTEEDVKKIFDLIHDVRETVEKETDRRVKCWNCKETDFEIISGFKICENCGCQNEHVLGYFDKRDEEQMFFRKKSIYKRRYHYAKKVDEVSKKIQLSEEEKYSLFNDLMEINDSVMERLNKKFNRKRMINILFLIKKILEEKGDEKSKLIEFKSSPKTLSYYEKWWNGYRSLKQPLCENASKSYQSGN